MSRHRVLRDQRMPQQTRHAHAQRAGAHRTGNHPAERTAPAGKAPRPKAYVCSSPSPSPSPLPLQSPCVPLSVLPLLGRLITDLPTACRNHWWQPGYKPCVWRIGSKPYRHTGMTGANTPACIATTATAPPSARQECTVARDFQCSAPAAASGLAARSASHRTFRRSPDCLGSGVCVRLAPEGGPALMIGMVHLFTSTPGARSSVRIHCADS